MNDYLAQLYGTGQQEPTEDLEKAAAAEVLFNLAAQQGTDLSDVDWSTVTTEEIAEIINEMQGTEKVAGLEGVDENAASQADLMGRVMAHSFYQELGEIEKTAGERGRLRDAQMLNEKGQLKARGRPEGAALQKAREAFEKEKMPDSPLKNFQKGTFGGRVKAMGKQLGSSFKHVGRAVRRHPVAAGLTGLGLIGAGGGAAYAAKKSSAIDELAAQRAMAWLQEQGVQFEEQEKQAGFNVDDVVNQRAYELLVENGWIEAE